jgi:hypothetical protein
LRLISFGVWQSEVKYNFTIYFLSIFVCSYFVLMLFCGSNFLPFLNSEIRLFEREKITTTKITTWKTKKNIKKFVNHHYIKKCLFSSSQHRNWQRSEHRKCLFSSSLLRQKRPLMLWIYLWRQKRSERQKSKYQLPMAYYLWLPRPVGG